MRYAAALLAGSLLLPAAAFGQFSPGAFIGVPTYSTYPSMPCAQCKGHAFDNYAIQAEPQDVKVGFRVLSTDGAQIGSVAYSDGRSAVVRTPTTLVRVPDEAFGKSQHGLVLRVSRSQLETLARQAEKQSD